VSGGRVFITVAPPGEPRADDPKKKRVDQQVVCFDAADGNEVWPTPVALGPEDKVDPGYRAACPTPAADGE
jgi:outer membrane protein assembly factor BamB